MGISQTPLRQLPLGKGSRVLVFGGTSEIGMGIAGELASRSDPSQPIEIVGISRQELKARDENIRFVVWNPRSELEISSVVRSLRICKSDVVVIAIGDLSLSHRSFQETLSDTTKLISNVAVNGLIPLQVFSLVANEMMRHGGGKLVVLSSVAAHPVMPGNSIYGSSKRLLDEIVLSMIRGLEDFDVQTILVRPGFVPTKLHSFRTESYLSTKLETVSKQVVRAIRKGKSGVLWIPPKWRVASWILTSIPLARRVAGTLMQAKVDQDRSSSNN